MALKGNTRVTSKHSGAILKQGIILPREHPTDPNLVFVHFGDKATSNNGKVEGGIWCHNMLGSFVRYRDIQNNPVSYGSYTPALPYAPVMVLMGESGAGIPMIMGFAPTNTNTPDPENREGLHVISQSPKGSLIGIDDTTGNIHIMYEKGNSSIILGNQTISFGLNTGDASGKEGNTSINMGLGSIEFKLRDSTMKFDESGLFVNFDDGGSYFKVTKSGIEAFGEKFVKLGSKDVLSGKAKNTTFQGTTDASITANHLKLGGKTLTSITGAQIDIRSTYKIQLTAINVGVRAFSLIDIMSPMRTAFIPASDTVVTGISATAAANFSVQAPTIAFGATTILQDGIVLSNSGMGNSTSTASTTGTQAASAAVYTGFMTAFTALLIKDPSISTANQIISDTLPGTSEPALEPSGNSGNAKDKNDTKSYASVYASKFAAKNTVMEKFSIVPNLITTSRSALLSASLGNNSPFNKIQSPYLI
jgi:hypothetical protein